MKNPLTLKKLIDLFDLKEKERYETCYVCGVETTEFVIHHTNYEPEITIPVCNNCHYEIHYSEKYPKLKPEKPRPDDYKSNRNEVKV